MQAFSALKKSRNYPILAFDMAGCQYGSPQQHNTGWAFGRHIGIIQSDPAGRLLENHRFFLLEKSVLDFFLLLQPGF